MAAEHHFYKRVGIVSVKNWTHPLCILSWKILTFVVFSKTQQLSSIELDHRNHLEKPANPDSDN